MINANTSNILVEKYCLWAKEISVNADLTKNLTKSCVAASSVYVARCQIVRFSSRSCQLEISALPHTDNKET